MSNLEGKHFLAEFTIHFFELNDDLPFVDLHCALCLKPLLQTLQVDHTYTARAAAWRDKRVESFIRSCLFLTFPAYLALSLRACWGYIKLRLALAISFLQFLFSVIGNNLKSNLLVLQLNLIGIYWDANVVLGYLPLITHLNRLSLWLVSFRIAFILLRNEVDVTHSQSYPAKLDNIILLQAITLGRCFILEVLYYKPQFLFRVLIHLS